MGVSTRWGIHGIYTGYSGSIHGVYICIGYVSGVCRVCIGKMSKRTGCEERRGIRQGTNIVHWLLLCSCKKHFA